MAGVLLLEDAIGVVDGVNIDFATPTPYISGTLNAFLNGNLQDNTNSQCFVELNPSTGTFRFTKPPRAANPAVPSQTDTRIQVVYQSPAQLTGGGADGGVPSVRAAQLVQPKVLTALDVQPKIVTSEDTNAVKPPRIASTERVAPRVAAALDLRPTIASSKEVF